MTNTVNHIPPHNLVLDDLSRRGLIAQVTDSAGLALQLNQGQSTVYAGFDPTADSLHVGSLLPLATLRRFQLAGHRPIVLVGGATGLIGDPSGKSNERPLNPASTVAHWSNRLQVQIESLLDFSGPTSARIVNNHDWFHGMSVLHFLRDIGKCVGVGTLMSRDAVKSRTDMQREGISYTEFSYALLQAYDFAHLNKKESCVLQIGGSDQWGNICSGIDLSHRLNGTTVYGLTQPLLVKSDGTKFGKSESGTVWLSANNTSPYQFFQFWLNTPDAEVGKYLMYFTFLTTEVIEELIEGMTNMTGVWRAKQMLAEELTRWVHGSDALQAAIRITKAVFHGNIADLQLSDYGQLIQDGMETYAVTQENKSDICRVLLGSGLASSLRQARYFLENNAIYLNSEVCTQDTLDTCVRYYGQYALLQRGQKRHVLLRWSNPG